MDWTTIAATVDYADILAFMASVVAFHVVGSTAEDL